MIQVGYKYESWGKVAFRRNLSPHLMKDMVSWCNEQPNDSAYYYVSAKRVVDPSTFMPVAYGAELWFERPEMKNWFMLRWGHEC